MDPFLRDDRGLPQGLIEPLLSIEKNPQEPLPSVGNSDEHLSVGTSELEDQQTSTPPLLTSASDILDAFSDRIKSVASKKLHEKNTGLFSDELLTGNPQRVSTHETEDLATQASGSTFPFDELNSDGKIMSAGSGVCAKFILKKYNALQCN